MKIKFKCAAGSFLVILVLGIILANRGSYPGSIDEEQATAIAVPYFQKQYGMAGTVTGVRYLQTGMYRYSNLIWVSAGEQEYTLYLNGHNKPAFDDVAESDAIASMDKVRIESRLRDLGMESDMDCFIGYNFDINHCQVHSYASQSHSPQPEQADEVYRLLTELHNVKIDCFSLSVYAPAFLRDSGKESDSGYYIDHIKFETDIDKAKFEKQYRAFAEQVHWDEAKFQRAMAELVQMGYQNVYFRMTAAESVAVSSHKIVLHCEGDSSLSGEQAENLLAAMDDSYFKIGDKPIQYTLDYQAIPPASAFYDIERQNDGIYTYSLTGADGLFAVRRSAWNGSEPTFKMVSANILEVNEADGIKLYFNVMTKQISEEMPAQDLSFPAQEGTDCYFISDKLRFIIDYGFYDADGNIAFASSCKRTPPKITMVSEEIAEMLFPVGTGAWATAFYNIRTHEWSGYATMNAFHLQDETMAYFVSREDGFFLYVANIFSPLYTAVQCPFTPAHGEIESIVDVSPIADNCVQIKYYREQTFDIVEETVEIPISISDISAGNAGEIGYYGLSESQLYGR